MRKSINLGVIVVVTTGSVPPIEMGIWTELYHAKGHGRAREGVTVFPCPDERIDVVNWVEGGRCHRLLALASREQGDYPKNENQAEGKHEFGDKMVVDFGWGRCEL